MKSCCIEKPSTVKLLIVHDTDNHLELLQEHVELNRHLYDIEVRSVPSGSEGLEVLSEWHPSVVVVDVFLDDMNGFEFVRHCRGETAAVVVTSTHGSEEIERSAIASGADAYFPGSDDPENLDCLIHDIVELAAEREVVH